MKNLILIIALFWISNSLFAQEKKFYEIAQQQEAAYVNLMEFTDPDFPTITKSVDPNTDIEYLNKLEQYAKLHPPCPILRHTVNDEQDRIQWQNGVNKWSQLNTHFPKFVPYHLFNHLLSSNDDLLFYEAAVKIWLSKNADKVPDNK